MEDLERLIDKIISARDDEYLDRSVIACRAAIAASPDAQRVMSN
jgi:hypothetical protein